METNFTSDVRFIRKGNRIASHKRIGRSNSIPGNGNTASNGLKNWEIECYERGKGISTSIWDCQMLIVTNTIVFLRLTNGI